MRKSIIDMLINNLLCLRAGYALSDKPNSGWRCKRSFYFKEVVMTKQELIEKYKAFKEGNKIFIKCFVGLDKTKVECAKAQIKLLDLVIKDLKKLY